MNKNITWQKPCISGFDRLKKFGRQPTTIWLTGLSGSGKSTIAQKVSKLLHQRNINEFILDGDNIRHGLCSDLNFSTSDRKENVRRISETAKILNEAGVSVLCPVISPYADHRYMAKKIIGNNKFIEVYCDCDLKTCEKRDPKGLYKLARQGKIKDFTGISSPYDPPTSPNLHIDTAQLSADESAVIILQCILNQEDKIHNIWNRHDNRN